MALILFLLFIQVHPVIMDNDLSVDLVLMTNEQVQSDDYEVEKLKATSREFRNVFTVAEDKVRLAVVARLDKDNYAPIMALSDNASLFEQNVEKYLTTVSGWSQNLDLQLKLYATIFSLKKIYYRARAILMLSWPIIVVLPDDQGEAKKLQDYKNADIFVVFYAAGERDKAQNKFQEFTGRPDNVISLGDNTFSRAFDVNVLRNFKTRLHERLCAYQEACFYTASDHNQCDPGYYTRKVPVDGGNCTALGFPPPSTIGINCSGPIDCDCICKELWVPESIPDCTPGSCGQTLPIPRTAKMPYPQLEHCPTTKTCPPCPTNATTTDSSTMTTTMTMTTGGSATSPGRADEQTTESGNGQPIVPTGPYLHAKACPCGIHCSGAVRRQSWRKIITLENRHFLQGSITRELRVLDK